MYNSRVLIYDRRSIIRLAKELGDDDSSNCSKLSDAKFASNFTEIFYIKIRVRVKGTNLDDPEVLVIDHDVNKINILVVTRYMLSYDTCQLQLEVGR